jgi:uncharacterized cupredoxin-like copper-binding protein
MRRSLGSAGAAVILVVLAGCSSQAPLRSGTTIPVTLKDYRISSSVATVRAGIVSFDVRNGGPSTHEFVVFATDRPADGLPLGADGLTVDEDSPLLRYVGEFSQVDIGRSRTLVVRLRAGSYVLVCNMEGHYLGGMYSVLTVR